MLYVSDAGTTCQPVLSVRLSGRTDHVDRYRTALSAHGLDLIDCSTLEAAQDMVRNGCRVGLFIVTQEAELARLDRWEEIVSNNRVCWVALVAQELIGKSRMREFIGEHLFNFITLPAELDHVVLTLRHAWGMAFMREVQRHPTPITQADTDTTIIGNTPQMQQMSSQIRKIASTDASVLISGPSGSGKELAALAIHRQSSRCHGPFIALNCGAIPPDRFQEELFGTNPQSSMQKQHIGKILAANGGTLFLDAIDDLPPDSQTSLLNYLNERAAARPLDNGFVASDVRLVGATHVSLADAVANGHFREDLYYRLNVMSLSVPRLADRGPDIEILARHYFAQFAMMHNRSLRGFSKAAMNALLAHTWPGNVRELINRVQRATVMAEGRFLQPEDLGLERCQENTQLMSLEDARASAERTMIRRALAQSRNQISRAASLLGISRVTLYRLIEKYNIRADGSNVPRAPFSTTTKRQAEVHK